MARPTRRPTDCPPLAVDTERLSTSPPEDGPEAPLSFSTSPPLPKALFDPPLDLSTSPPAGSTPGGIHPPDGVLPPPLSSSHTGSPQKDHQKPSPEAESAVLRLLRKSSRTPEELLEGALELSLAGVLSTETLSSLCRSMGLADEQSALILRSSQQQALLSQPGAAVSHDVSNPALSISSLLQPASSSTALSLAGGGGGLGVDVSVALPGGASLPGPAGLGGAPHPQISPKRAK